MTLYPSGLLRDHPKMRSEEEVRRAIAGISPKTVEPQARLVAPRVDPYRVLSLFAGIGGFDLGLERVGMKTVAFVENDPFCRRVLAKHWPGVPCHDDIRTFDARAIAADVVCGGFPCQPFSTASRGRRLGTQDDRYLWPEMLRVIAECRPAWVIGENVIGIGSLALEQVVSGLEGIGYAVATFDIPACAVRHDHRRSRYWFLGHANDQGECRRTIDAEMAELQGLRSVTEDARAPHGFPRGMDGHRRRVIGNSASPNITEILGRAILATANADAPKSAPSVEQTQVRGASSKSHPHPRPAEEGAF